jgi:hypothetical protein
MHKLGLLQPAEFEGFSQRTRDTVQAISGHPNRCIEPTPPIMTPRCNRRRRAELRSAGVELGFSVSLRATMISGVAVDLKDR